MAITTTTFNYPVAKIIDTPWNTIINGLNYTKTNLTPLGLRYVDANNYDNGLILKEFTGNSIKDNSPLINFSYNNAIQDYSDINKYWIINSSHLSTNKNGPALYCATKAIDSNGFEYTILTDACPELTKFRNNGYFIYQDESSLWAVLNDVDYNTSPDQDNRGNLYKFIKVNNILKLDKKTTNFFGYMQVLKIENGYIYLFYKYQNPNIVDDLIEYGISKISLSSDTLTSKNLYNKTMTPNSILATPSNLIDATVSYFYEPYENKWYKITLDNNSSTANFEEINIDIDNSYVANDNKKIKGNKRFLHVYTTNTVNCLAVISLNAEDSTSTFKSSIQLYTINENNLNLKQTIYFDGFSFIPKNDWNTLFIGTSYGLNVYSWDSLNCEFIENPNIPIILQEFGFDLDERLWLLDVQGNVFRYTYNQPVTVDYRFEKDTYFLEKDPLETYVKVRVLNYSGKYISSKLIIKAFGNFTFENNQKEMEITLSSDNYIEIPIYLTGGGKYEIRL